MIDIEKLAIKYRLLYTKSEDEHTKQYLERLKAVADEYLALSSSEPLGFINERRYDHYTGAVNRLMVCRIANITHDIPVFEANPLNQQLLSERNAISAWLKDGETVIQRLERERAEVCSMLGMLAKERKTVESVVSERNECVEEIKRLTDALRNARATFMGLQPDTGGAIARQMGLAINRINEALSTTDSIQKLLNTSLENKID